MGKILSKQYTGPGKAWNTYLKGLKKEVHLVDRILATGGSGQGETLKIPRQKNSKLAFVIDLIFLERKTILIELDETLVHSEALKSNKTYDVVINMGGFNSKIEDVRKNYRIIFNVF